MYQTRAINKNVHDISGKSESNYITINDPYKNFEKNLHQLPPRWKGVKDKDTFKWQNKPLHEGGSMYGHFSDKKYTPEKYIPVKSYRETQPGARPNGFGGGDASRRDEFAATIRTEQYRESLKKEARVMQRQYDPAQQAAVARELEEESKPKERKFLYDVGKTAVTEFDAKSGKDIHYVPKLGPNSYTSGKRMGGAWSSSGSIGAGAWETKLTKPEHGNIAPTKNFNDRGHLQM